MFEVKVERDTIANGTRLSTIVATYPRYIHAQLMTHRVFSRNAQSSRAFPVAKMLERVEFDPVMPTYWGKEQRGMEAQEELTDRETIQAEDVWQAAAKNAAYYARRLMNLGVHKQVTNRLLEPFTTITVLISATEWDNFFKLRCHHAAQPEMQKLATMIREALESSTPNPPGEAPVPGWHTPFIRPDDPALALPRREDILKVSVARCARVSYLNHEGQLDLGKDLSLADRLLSEGHWSPFEHVAIPTADVACKGNLTGNFFGWIQFRKFYELQIDKVFLV